MSRTYRGKDRRIRIRSQRKKPIDIRKLGAAIIALAEAQGEKEAETQHQQSKTGATGSKKGRARRAASA